MNPTRLSGEEITRLQLDAGNWLNYHDSRISLMDEFLGRVSTLCQQALADEELTPSTESLSRLEIAARMLPGLAANAQMLGADGIGLPLSPAVRVVLVQESLALADMLLTLASDEE